MRWIKKNYYKSTRVVRKFALFPICVGDETRWLETVYILQKRAFPGAPYWTDVDFVTKEEYYFQFKKEEEERDEWYESESDVGI